MSPYSKQPTRCSWLPAGEMRPGNGDWILVRRGSADDVHQLIAAHAGLSGTSGDTYEVKVQQSEEGWLAVSFSPKLYPYEFCCLITWLDAPPPDASPKKAS